MTQNDNAGHSTDHGPGLAEQATRQLGGAQWWSPLPTAGAPVAVPPTPEQFVPVGNGRRNAPGGIVLELAEVFEGDGRSADEARYLATLVRKYLAGDRVYFPAIDAELRALRDAQILALEADGNSLREISRVVGIGHERVRRVIKRARRKNEQPAAQ